MEPRKVRMDFLFLDDFAFLKGVLLFQNHGRDLDIS